MIQVVVFSMIALLDFSAPSSWALILLAIHLIGASCSITVIVWSEHFDTQPDNSVRNRFGVDPVWLAMNLVSILIWLFILVGIHLELLAIPEDSVMADMFARKEVGSPISFEVPITQAEPIYWSLMATQSLLLMSSTGGIHVGRPRTHWSLPLLASIVSLLSISLGVVSELGISVITTTIPLLVLSGTCSWIYGEARRRLLAVPFATVLTIACCLSAAESVDSTVLQYQVFLLSPILVILLFLASGWSTKPNSLQSKSTRVIAFLSLSSVALGQMYAIFGEQDDIQLGLVFVALVAAYSAQSLRNEHFRSVQPRSNRVVRILERRSVSGEVKEFTAGIPIFGLSQSGKSTFLTALWTIVQDPLARDLWWWKEGIEERIESLNKVELEELLEKDEPTEEVEDLLRYRSSMHTCSQWRDRGELPSSESVFPFMARATGQAEKDLNEFKNIVNNFNEEKRDLLDVTIVQSDIELSFQFDARIRTESRDFFPIPVRVGEEDSRVRVNIQTFDHPGETFRDAVDLLRDLIGYKVLEDFIAGRKLPDDIQEQHGIGRHQSDRGSKTQSAAKHILQAKSMIFIVNCDALCDPTNEKYTSVQTGTENFLSMLSELRENGHNELEAIQIALNRADALLPGKSTREHYDPNIPDNWSSLSDNNMAFSVINDRTNQIPAGLQSEGVFVDSRFVCNFGGIVDTKIKGKTILPPYPMLPVNVMESLISVLMGSNLRSRGG